MTEPVRARFQHALSQHELFDCSDHLGGAFCCVCGAHEIPGMRPHLAAVLAQQFGRPLGAASGGLVDFWGSLGHAEDGLPQHLPMGVNQFGQGPEADQDAHHYACWCGDAECPLTLALGHAWASAWRAQQRVSDPTKGTSDF